LEYIGIPVVHVSSVSLSRTDVNFFSIANNKFHDYVIKRFFGDDVRGCINISLMHDVQIAQNINGMFERNEISISEVRSCFDGEYPGIDFAEMLISGKAPMLFTFTALGMSRIICESRHLLVHSYYARNKITLESGRHADGLPKISVVRHPLEEPATRQPGRPAGERTFIVGCFGGVREFKRVHVVIEAYGRMCRAWPEFRGRSRLLVAGELPSPARFDPRGQARRSGIEDKVEFTGYLSDEAFLARLAEVDLQFNLRFPSCGETSGALYAGRSMGGRIAVTSYQSFREEAADSRISVHPDQEFDDVLMALRLGFDAWRTDAGRMATVRGGEGLPKPMVAEVLTDLLSSCG
jgi:glycosyltransferase involved in cell wall biosynthesis